MPDLARRTAWRMIQVTRTQWIECTGGDGRVRERQAVLRGIFCILRADMLARCSRFVQSVRNSSGGNEYVLRMPLRTAFLLTLDPQTMNQNVMPYDISLVITACESMFDMSLKAPHGKRGVHESTLDKNESFTLGQSTTRCEISLQNFV